MRYIKTYDSLNYLYPESSPEELSKMGYPERFKFKFNDYVRFKNNSNFKDTIFKVKVIDASVGVTLIYKLEDVNEISVTWTDENSLELVPDYEVAANIYNL